MSYCTPSDAASVNKARIIGQGNNPTASDVAGYCAMISGEIDAILTTRGYVVPVSVASNPEAAGFLQSVAVKGVVWMMEQAVPTNKDARDSAKIAYDAAIKMLSDAKFSFDSPSETERSQVRAPFITFQPEPGTFDPTLQAIGGHRGDGISGRRNNPQLPMFSRGMQF